MEYIYSLDYLIKTNETFNKIFVFIIFQSSNKIYR